MMKVYPIKCKNKETGLEGEWIHYCTNRQIESVANWCGGIITSFSNNVHKSIILPNGEPIYQGSIVIKIENIYECLDSDEFLEKYEITEPYGSHGALVFPLNSDYALALFSKEKIEKVKEGFYAPKN